MKNPKVNQIHIAGDAFLVEFSYDGFDIHGEGATITNRAVVIDEDYCSLMDKTIEEWKASPVYPIQEAARKALQRELDDGYEFSYPVFGMRSTK